MSKPPRQTDLWTCAIAPAPIADLAAPGALAAIRDRLVFLPDPGPFRFRADPFGRPRADGGLDVLVEAFDYRAKRGFIEAHRFDADLRWREARPVLRPLWHLSYPILLEAEGEIFMAPEAFRQPGGGVRLYRAVEFPWRWEAAALILPGLPLVDATPFRAEGRWWLAFSLVDGAGGEFRRLHLAFAHALAGPWTLHPANPVRDDPGGGRMAGTPFLAGERLHFPVQDCRATYGAGVRLLSVADLSPNTAPEFTQGPRLGPEAVGKAGYGDGLHTLSACGAFTLLDVKRHSLDRGRAAIDRERRWRRLTRRPAPWPG